MCTKFEVYGIPGITLGWAIVKLQENYKRMENRLQICKGPYISTPNMQLVLL